MVQHKTNLRKLKKIEIISSIFSDHNGLKLETNFKRKTQKYSNIWKVNIMLLYNDWINNEIKKEIKKYLETNENEHTTTSKLWDVVKAVLTGKVIAIQVYLKKIEKSQINSLTLHLEELREQQTKPIGLEGRK